MFDEKGNNGNYEIKKAMETGDWSFIKYAIDFEKNLRNLEINLHNADDPEVIAKNALIAAVEYYDGDWCGIIEADLSMEAWSPLWWYNRVTRDMTATKFLELEDTAAFSSWVSALYKGEAVIIPDTSVYKELNPDEYDVYKRLDVQSIIAVPYWKNPTGFMLVRNPKKHCNYSSYLQMLAYVAFSSITEKKLIERTNRGYSSSNIKKDTDVVINLFGNLEICTSKGKITEGDLNSPKISRFLTYLLLNKNQHQIPRVICEKIWPDEITDKPSDKLKALVFRLQRAFNIVSDYRLIVSTNYGYQLNPELNIMTDLDIFDDFCEQSRRALASDSKIELLKRALDLYKGSILESAKGELWLLSNDIMYNNKFSGAFSELLKTFYEVGDYYNVQYYASKALEVDSKNENAYFWLIKAMSKTGNSEMAKYELKTAHELLISDEYDDLERKLHIHH